MISKIISKVEEADLAIHLAFDDQTEGRRGRRLAVEGLSVYLRVAPDSSNLGWQMSLVFILGEGVQVRRKKIHRQGLRDGR